MTATMDTDFDYLIIGGGSGGIASGKRAAMHGAKVASTYILLDRMFPCSSNSNTLTNMPP